MYYSFLFVFLLFIIYSVIGYLVEIISCTIYFKKLSLSRGYLIGPYIPIYGEGAILISILLNKYKDDILVLFIMGMLICSVLEYFTSLIMEKLFKLRWWDYSTMPFNINGRICLEYGVLFGFGGVLIVNYVNPFLVNFLSSLPKSYVYVIGTVVLIPFLVDLIESTYIIFHLKVNINKYTNQDATMTIKREVIKSFKKHRTFTNRLLKAFPDVREVKKGQVDIKKTMKKIKKERSKNNEK
ncbi:MAG: hypothetical protein E7160_04745 [Firmicutes bacterium]|nr:hypothetical protein [Bacillota bacterium]